MDHVHGYLRLNLTSEVNVTDHSQRVGYELLIALKLTNTINSV